MGRLLDGKWITHDLGADAQGRFIRRATQFRKMEIEPVSSRGNRYVLIISWACGWCHRVMLVRAYLGIEETIPVIVCDPFMGEDGWTIKKGIPRSELWLNQSNSTYDGDDITRIHELYTLAKKDYTGRASVPILWDKQLGTIVNNESSDIVKIFLKQFGPTQNPNVTPNNPDLLPSDQQEKIEAMIDSNYGPINNGVYRCGFASSQSAYEEAATSLFERLDELEEILGQQRFLVGDSVTLADFCLFPTLIRFDHVYHTHFKCNRRHIYEYPNLWGWTKEIYQMPYKIKDTCQFDDIREHYYTSHESIHPRRYVPLGPQLDLDSPHGRDRMYKKKKKA